MVTHLNPHTLPDTGSEQRVTYYKGSDLEAMSGATNYYAWIEGIFQPYFKGKGMEVGAGSGNFTHSLRSHPFTSLVALEPSEDMYALLSKRFANDTAITPHNKTLSEMYREFPESFDSVVYINVLEHVEDDARELTYINYVLKKGGHVCVFVPALAWLYSAFDASVGHHRRYYKRDLEMLIESKGFEIVRSSYFDFLGIWLWFIFFTVLGLTLGGRGAKTYDTVIVPIMRRIESIISAPIGKNIILVARKK